MLLGNGTGGFQSEVEYATGEGTSALALGDLNGDGKLDLATVNEQNSVSVLLNQGDGSFGGKIDYRTGDGNTSVAIGDLNGDATPDLATANAYASTVSVLLNNGDGSFRAGREYRTARGPKSVAIGDLNGDAKPDLAIADGGCACASVGISVLANRGDGTFRPKVDFPAGRGSGWVAIGDLNGDGRRDVATANSGANTVSVLLSATRGCTVPNVTRKTVLAAGRALAHAKCRVGRVHRAYSKVVKKGRVISQMPKFGAVRPGGARSTSMSAGDGDRREEALRLAVYGRGDWYPGSSGSRTVGFWTGHEERRSVARIRQAAQLRATHQAALSGGRSSGDGVGIRPLVVQRRRGKQRRHP